MENQRFILLLQDELNEPWRPQVLDETGLSRFFKHQHYAMDAYPGVTVLWADSNGVVWNVVLEWTHSPYDEDDYADAQAQLKVNGQTVGDIGYRVDGRA